MIDTVKIRIHGINDVKKSVLSEIHKEAYGKSNMILPSHYELYQKMLQYKGKHFSKRVNYIKEKVELNELNDEEYALYGFGKEMTKHYQIRDMMSFTEETWTKKVIKSVTGNHEIGSSYHGVTFLINDEKGFIEYQLSIPKYLYGHSLAQFVPQKHSELYERNVNVAHKWIFQYNNLYERLIKFIRTFCNDLMILFDIAGKINLNYVELMRIDFCFNQYFESKEIALRYLENLKVLNVRRHGKEGEKADTYKTSLTYTSREGAYFKIYHKGTEYAESKFGDLKKHKKINDRYLRKRQMNAIDKKHYQTYSKLIDALWDSADENGKIKWSSDKRTRHIVEPLMNKIYKNVPFKIPFLKSEMDKILRYEISLKGTFLTYTYKTKVFRKNCQLHNKYFLNYKKVKSIYDSRNTNKDESKVPKWAHKNYEMFNRWINSKSALMLGNNQIISRFETNGNIDWSDQKGRYIITAIDMQPNFLNKTDVGLFSEDMLKFCVKYFLKHVRKYQVQSFSNYEDLTAKIKQYNKDVIDRQKDYNERNFHLTLNTDGTPIVKNGRKIYKAVQLLKQSEVFEMKLKKVNALNLTTIIKFMKKGKSLNQIRNEMGLTPNQFCRYKKDLALFGIEERTRFEAESIETCLDFSAYYEATESREKDYKYLIEQKLMHCG